MSESYIKFGALLKLERERRGAKLEVVSSDLKIPIDTLQYLEAGQQDALPSELYFRLFAKSYAEYLGVDFTKTLDAIREELGEIVEPLTPEQAAEPGRKPRPEVVPAPIEEIEEKSSARTGLLIGMAILVLAGLAVGAYFLFFASDGPTQSETPAETVQPAYSDTQNNFGWDSTVPKGDSILLTLTARIGSWATVLADGDTMVFQMLSPGRPYNVTARRQLLVTIGNPLVVDVTLNGQPATLADPESGEVAQVEIDSNTLEMFFIPSDSGDTAGIQGTTADSNQAATGSTGGR
jgi:cytoskeletal protein RodZ